MSIFSRRPARKKQYISPYFKPVRRHKGATFFYEKGYTTKRECKSYLARTKRAYQYHYRIYPSKHHGYGVYIGPPKARHGGVR